MPERVMSEALIRRYYAYLNEHRLDEAADLLAIDAVREHPSLTHTSRDGDESRPFAERWLRAFPDGQITIDHLEPRGDTICEVHLIGTGTHQGDFDLGPSGLFKATGASVTVRFRQLLEVRSGRITYATLSFDLQELIRQLVAVDDAQLMRCLERIRRLTDELARVQADVEQRCVVIDRLGPELDAARRVIRPYFYP